MASMFRAVKYEKYEQLHAAFVRLQRSNNDKYGKKIQHVVAKAGISLKAGMDDTAVKGDYEELKDSEADDDDDDDNDEDDEDESEDSVDGGGDSDDDDDKSDKNSADSDDVDLGNIEDSFDRGGGKDGKGGDGEMDNDENESIEERVFVCVGRMKKGGQKQAVWVMTINQDWNGVTMWNAVQHK